MAAQPLEWQKNHGAALITWGQKIYDEFLDWSCWVCFTKCDGSLFTSLAWWHHAVTEQTVKVLMWSLSYKIGYIAKSIWTPLQLSSGLPIIFMVPFHRCINSSPDIIIKKKKMSGAVIYFHIIPFGTLWQSCNSHVRGFGSTCFKEHATEQVKAHCAKKSPTFC